MLKQAVYILECQNFSTNQTVPPHQAQEQHHLSPEKIPTLPTEMAGLTVVDPCWETHVLEG